MTTEIQDSCVPGANIPNIDIYTNLELAQELILQQIELLYNTVAEAYENVVKAYFRDINIPFEHRWDVFIEMSRTGVVRPYNEENALTVFRSQWWDGGSLLHVIDAIYNEVNTTPQLIKYAQKLQEDYPDQINLRALQEAILHDCVFWLVDPMGNEDETV